MHRALGIVLAVGSLFIAALPAEAGDQGFRRWWGIGYGEGYHAASRCCAPLYYPYYQAPHAFDPSLPLEVPTPAPGEPEPLGPSVRRPRPASSGPWTRLPRGPESSRISR